MQTWSRLPRSGRVDVSRGEPWTNVVSDPWRRSKLGFLATQELFLIQIPTTKPGCLDQRVGTMPGWHLQ